MPYTPTVWSTGDVITATKLNNLEIQYAQAVADAVGTAMVLCS